jgi:hypothetical protein
MQPLDLVECLSRNGSLGEVVHKSFTIRHTINQGQRNNHKLKLNVRDQIQEGSGGLSRQRASLGQGWDRDVHLVEHAIRLKQEA